jgi:RNA polymerase sigma factor (sigma-70 family)
MPRAPHLSRDEQIAELYRDHADTLIANVAKRLHATPSDPVVDDACQEAWLLLVRHPDVAIEGRIRGWLHLVAIREAWRLHKRDTRDARGGRLLVDEPVLGPEDLAVDRERHHARRAALAELNPRQQRDLFLQAAGYGYDEIAALTDTPRNTVNRHLRDGRARLGRIAGDLNGQDDQPA